MLTRGLLEVVDVRKTYSVRQRGSGRRVPLEAVRGVSFDVSEGTSLGVIGESGSGKSTLARLIVGLETPTEGRVVISGSARSRVRARRAERKRFARHVQMVFQDPYSSLDPRQRVGDSLFEMLDFHFGLPGEKRKLRARQLLEEVGLDDRVFRSYPAALSGGQRQRVAIVRAMAAGPRLLVLDEAVASLDVSIQAQVLNLLNELREQEGVAYVFLSHDLAVIRQIADDVLVMKSGQVVDRGSTSQVLDRSRDPYTRRLMEAMPRPGWTPTRRSGRE